MKWTNTSIYCWTIWRPIRERESFTPLDKYPMSCIDGHHIDNSYTEICILPYL